VTVAGSRFTVKMDAMIKQLLQRRTKPRRAARQGRVFVVLLGVFMGDEWQTSMRERTEVRDSWAANHDEFIGGGGPRRARRVEARQFERLIGCEIKPGRFKP